MYGEISWPHIDRLLLHYSVLSAHVGQLPTYEGELSRICRAMQCRLPTMHDFSDFLAPRIDHREQVMRSLAWCSQHALECRAVCVGQRVVFVRKGKGANKGGELQRDVTSPLIDQVELFGFKANEVDLRGIDRSWARKFRKHENLDVLLFNIKKGTVYLVKGQSYSYARRISPSLRVVPRGSEERRTLWGNDLRFLHNLKAPSESVATVLFARDVLSQAFPDLKFVPLFVTISDPGVAWHFFMQDMSGMDEGMLNESRVDMDMFPVHSTSEDFSKLLEEDEDAFARLPGWTTKTALEKAPVDLPTRAVMFLDELRQLQKVATKRLVLREPSEIARLVTKKYGIVYPRDMYRHDAERLERVGLVRRGPDSNLKVGLTPIGLGRLLLLEQQFNPLLPPAPSILLDGVSDQERLWAEAPVL